MDISKTGHIIDFVNRSDIIYLGSSLFDFVWAIVSAFWPSKPVNIDTFIASAVYNVDCFGCGAVPPGFFAEMYLNFLHIGLFLGPILFGFLLRILTNIQLANIHSPLLFFFMFYLQNIGVAVLEQQCVFISHGLFYVFYSLTLYIPLRYLK